MLERGYLEQWSAFDSEFRNFVTEPRGWYGKVDWCHSDIREAWIRIGHGLIGLLMYLDT